MSGTRLMMKEGGEVREQEGNGDEQDEERNRSEE